MHHKHSHRALIVSNEHHWRRRLVPELNDSGWDLYVVSRANEGADLLAKKRFDLIVVDDSLHDMDPPEFCLAISDLAPNQPVVLVAGEEADRYAPIWKRCGVHLAGSREEIGRSMRAAIRYAAENVQ